MKLTMYPKTRRYDDTAEIRITEKLDGSNISFFKKDGGLTYRTKEQSLQVG